MRPRVPGTVWPGRAPAGTGLGTHCNRAPQDVVRLPCPAQCHGGRPSGRRPRTPRTTRPPHPATPDQRPTTRCTDAPRPTAERQAARNPAWIGHSPDQAPLPLGGWTQTSSGKAPQSNGSNVHMKLGRADPPPPPAPTGEEPSPHGCSTYTRSSPHVDVRMGPGRPFTTWGRLDEILRPTREHPRPCASAPLPRCDPAPHRSSVSGDPDASTHEWSLQVLNPAPSVNPGNVSSHPPGSRRANNGLDGGGPVVHRSQGLAGRLPPSEDMPNTAPARRLVVRQGS